MSAFIVTATVRLRVERDSEEEARDSVRYMDSPELELPYGMKLLGEEIEVRSVEPSESQE